MLLSPFLACAVAFAVAGCGGGGGGSSAAPAALRFKVVSVTPMQLGLDVTAGWFDSAGNSYASWLEANVYVNGTSVSLPVPSGTVYTGVIGGGGTLMWGNSRTTNDYKDNGTLIWDATNLTAQPKSIAGYEVLAVRPDGLAAIAMKTGTTTTSIGLLDSKGNFQDIPAADKAYKPNYTYFGIDQSGQIAMSDRTGDLSVAISPAGALVPFKVQNSSVKGPVSLNDAGFSMGSDNNATVYWDASGAEHSLKGPSGEVPNGLQSFISTTGFAVAALSPGNNQIRTWVWPHLTDSPVLLDTLVDGAPANTKFCRLLYMTSDGSRAIANAYDPLSNLPTNYFVLERE